MEPPKSCLFALNNLETNDEIAAEFIQDKDFLIQTLTGNLIAMATAALCR